MLKKAQDNALKTRMAEDAINRRQLISIATGVVRANDPTLLKVFHDDLVLTEKWARRALEKLKWNKCKGTTGNHVKHITTFEIHSISLCCINFKTSLYLPKKTNYS